MYHTIVCAHEKRIHYLKVITADKQPAHRMIVKHIRIPIIALFNRLQLPVVVSDGYANTSSAALLTIYIA